MEQIIESEENNMTETEKYIAELVAKGKAAQKAFELNWTTQRQVDEVVRDIGKTVYDHRRELSQMAVDESGMGNVEGKMAKFGGIIGNWNFLRGKKSVGYLDIPENENYEPGVRVIAKPLGVIGCIMPSTNPVITGVGNAMMALKCRNAVIIAPHPSTAHSSMGAVNYMRQALKKLGAPEDLVQGIDAEHASIEATQAMLAMCDVNIATGGAGMVKAVYSSGRPGMGVGPGNCQAIIDEDYDDMAGACSAIVQNRSFDLGIPCIGEQTAHVPAAREEEFKKAMVAAGSYLVEDEETIAKFRELFFPGGKPYMNRKFVGHTVQQVGAMIGLEIPADRIGICLKCQSKGTEDLLNKEILCSITRYRTYETFEDGVDAACHNLLDWEGTGHSSSIWSHNEEHISYAANRVPVGRLHVNQPTRGNNNGLNMTVTVGCGSWGNNSICENLQYYHLMNKTKVTVTLPNKRMPKDTDWNDFDICPVLED